MSAHSCLAPARAEHRLIPEPGERRTPVAASLLAPEEQRSLRTPGEARAQAANPVGKPWGEEKGTSALHCLSVKEALGGGVRACRSL